MNNILELKNLEKKYENVNALDGVNLEFKEGEFVVVIGPSGAGKSTLIRSINRLVTPSSGEIIFDGNNIEAISGKQLRNVRSEIGMIFQHYNLVERTNVFKNVLHGRLGYMSSSNSLFNNYSEEDKQKAIDLMEKVGIKDQMYKRADELSGGQMQRVGICRALLQNPKILLADEPIASLDPKSAKVVMDSLHKTTRSQGLTVIVNLHQVDFAKEYASRIIGLKKGKVVFDGCPSQLTDDIIFDIYEGKEEQMKLKEA